MKKMIACADDYIKNSNLAIIGMLKVCAVSLGMFLGMQIPKKYKLKAGIATAIVFVVTYISLLVTFIKSAIKFYKEKS